MKNKMIFLKQIISFILIFFITLTSLAQKNKEVALTVESGVIPPDFNQQNDTLLIYSGNPIYNMGIKKKFKKNYTGYFTITKKPEDYTTEHCRYILFEETEEESSHYQTNGVSHPKTVHSSFYILDRITKKKYYNTNAAASKNVLAYIEVLDTARKK